MSGLGKQKIVNHKSSQAKVHKIESFNLRTNRVSTSR